MRTPSGYGSVIKLSGKRRRPFAVRTSKMIDYVVIWDERLTDFDRRALENADFKLRQGKWFANVTDAHISIMERMESQGHKVSMTQRQEYVFHEYFAKRDEAYKYLADLNVGTIQEPTNKEAPTLKELYESWVDYKKKLKKQLSASTWKAYNTAYRRLKSLHDRRISEITTGDIQPILNSLSNKSSATVINIKIVLGYISSYAKMNHYIDHDLTEYLVFEYAGNQNIHTAFTDEELKSLWDRQDNLIVDMILINIYTGVRPQELVTIKTSDVFLDEQYMTGGSKTEAGRNRIIPVADKILPLVKKFYDPTKEYLFVGSKREHMPYDTYYNYFLRIMSDIGIKHIPHDCRHTFATLMDRAGANPICTKKIMGHTLGKDITQSVYTHKTLDDLLEAVNLLFS